MSTRITILNDVWLFLSRFHSLHEDDFLWISYWQNLLNVNARCSLLIYVSTFLHYRRRKDGKSDQYWLLSEKWTSIHIEWTLSKNLQAQQRFDEEIEETKRRLDHLQAQGEWKQKCYANNAKYWYYQNYSKQKYSWDIEINFRVASTCVVFDETMRKKLHHWKSSGTKRERALGPTVDVFLCVYCDCETITMLSPLSDRLFVQALWSIDGSCTWWQTTTLHISIEGSSFVDHWPLIDPLKWTRLVDLHHWLARRVF